MTSPRALLAAWNIKAKKRLGQRFLSDPSTAKMIVSRSQLQAEDIVLEIGAGLGALTIPLAQNVKRVHAVEIDPHLAALLKTELLSNQIDNVTIVQKNILDFDISKLAREAGHPLLVMGNLPYNISSQVIVKLIDTRASISRAVLMLQKELAQRITAQPGKKDYGRLTVMLNYCASVQSIAQVKAPLFFPLVKVDSEVIEIDFKPTPPERPDDETFFFRVVKAAFAQRRKTLRNALAGSELHLEPKIARQALERIGIDPSRRAETLMVPEFVRLSNTLGQIFSVTPKPTIVD